MRLLIYLALIFLIYYLFKSLSNALSPNRDKKEEKLGTRTRGRIDDELVKDPACGVYVAKRQAIRVRIKGRDYYFCSESCKEKFISSQN